jgi:uncharacterized protein (DUF2384 family)
MAKSRKYDEAAVLETVPANLRESEMFYLHSVNRVDWQYVNALKTFSEFNDEVIAGWLDISVKTFRQYKKPDSVFKDSIKERVLLLLSVIKHGADVFGSAKKFEEWLNKENFFFDKKCPSLFMNTVGGLKFIDNSLTGMEYGDNV